MTVGSVFVFLSVRWLVFERVMSYRLILYFYPRCRISERCFPVYWLYKYLHTACISNAMGNIWGTLGTELVTEPQISSQFTVGVFNSTQFLPQRLLRHRGTVSVSLPTVLWQIWSPNLLFCCKKGLTPELWMLRKALLCHRSAVSSCLEAADSSLSHCHNSSAAASWTPVHLCPKLFFFFLFPLLLYPEPTSSLLRSQSFQIVCWSGGKEKKSEMSLSPRNIKSGAGKKKMFFPLINPGWVRYFVEHSRLYGKKKNMRRKKKCLPTC